MRSVGKGRILEIATERIGLCDGIEIAIESENVQSGDVSADCHPHPAALDAAQGHQRHACPLRSELRREPPAEPGRADAFAEAGETALQRWQQRGYTLSHAVILAHKGVND